MGKLILLIATLLLVSCTNNPPKIKIQEVNKPILYVPEAPNIPKPHLQYFDLTPQQKNDNGELAKALRIDYIVLIKYIKLYGTVIDKYIELAKTNPDFSELSVEDKTKIEKFKEELNKIIKSTENK